MERYTAEQLQNQSKEELIDMYIDLQNRALVTAGRLALYQENQFGSKSEIMSAVAPDDQVNIFNEVEASFAEDTPEPTIEDVGNDGSSGVRIRTGFTRGDRAPLKMSGGPSQKC